VKRFFYVYILASLSGTLYVGVTDDLPRRMWQHKQGTFDGFTKQYEVNRLLYFETFTDAQAAAAREIQIKGYRREKKIGLFRQSNPSWKDLSSELLVLM
jgi:putative endonuclease